MSAPSHPSSADAIKAAAHELKLRRTAEATARAPAGKARTKAEKPKKPKTVRCKVHLAESEYRELGKLKKRLARQGVDTGKEQLIRAGLLLLAHLDASNLKAAIRDVIAPEPAINESA